MSDSKNNITEFEPLFTFRTGLTLLIKKNEFFEKEDEEEIFFETIKDSDKNIALFKGNSTILVQEISPQHITSSVEKGFIMFYETNNKGEVVRNTVCKYRKN